MSIATSTLRALGTDVTLAVNDPAALERARLILVDELVAIDRTCSRFRADSELVRIGTGGRPVVVSALLFEALAVSLDVARRTGGAVDPTVGAALAALGYDRDFADVVRLAGRARSRLEPKPASGWWTVELDRARRTVRIPPGTRLDLGASAKALVTDRAANRIAAVTGAGVLVSVGGDVAVAGDAPDGGWPVGIATSSGDIESVQQVVAIAAGGLASSSTVVRAWSRAGVHVHHIVDPRTGASAAPYWTLVSATGATCVEANAASTAAVVWGRRALGKLAALGQPARLVRHDGHVAAVNGWPVPETPTRSTETTGAAA